MYGWSFAAADLEELGRLLRALERHRYLRRTDHQLHRLVDVALAGDPRFAHHAEGFHRLRGELDVTSRDPRLWRPTDVDEVLAVLAAFWEQRGAGERLAGALRDAGFEPPEHAPFSCPVDDAPHPELVLLDWELLPVDQLDAERHAGALRAMESAAEEVDASEVVYVELEPIAEPELLAGARGGVLVRDPMVWADGPYSYCDYVFRGVARAARLVEPPAGYRDA